MAADLGRRLAFTVNAEPLLWAVEGQVPEIVSFGGLGTYVNQQPLPTTSVITAPWSLWAPAFGTDATDIARFRRQTFAVGDVVIALDPLARSEIGGYLAGRPRRRRSCSCDAPHLCEWTRVASVGRGRR